MTIATISELSKNVRVLVDLGGVDTDDDIDVDDDDGGGGGGGREPTKLYKFVSTDLSLVSMSRKYPTNFG